MNTVVGIQSAIWANRSKTTLLILLFPALLFGVFWGAFYLFALLNPQNPLFSQSPTTSTPLYGQTLLFTLNIFSYLLPILFLWCVISFFFHRQLIFSFSQARPLSRKESPKIYNIVENLCISRGLATPNIGILDDTSKNAFAVGWNMKNAWIVFSQGILDELSDSEIEAVAAHELTHIMNKDGLLLTAVIVFIGAVGIIGEILFRSGLNMSSSSSDKKDGNAKMLLIVVGGILLFLGYCILPLVQLAISRKREFLADAGSSQLTKNPEALISALQKISQDATIESIKKESLSALCIESPFIKTSGRSSFLHNLFSTHPSIEERIALLQKY